MQKKKAFLVVVLIFLGIFFGSGTAAGSTLPKLERVETLEALVNWYESEAGAESSAMLTGDLSVNSTFKLSETETMREIGAIQHVLCVESGGVLILDNPNLVLQGPETVVVVKDGGQLLLERGTIYTGPGKAIVVEKGGEITLQSEFQLFGGGIWNENEENSAPPSLPDVTPEPPGKFPIRNIVGDRFDVFCSVGKPPEQYPATVTVAYEKAAGIYEQVAMPINWQLDSVDFQTPGTYEVVGSFAREDLETKGLTNPQNLGVVLRITVRKPQPIDSMKGRFVRVGAQGDALVQLTLPALPEDAKALYMYRSADGKSWEQVSGKNPQNEYTDFLSFSQQQGLHSYVNYRYQSDFRDIWMKVKVVGSDYDGFSNAVRIQIPADARPGVVVRPGSDPEDGSLDGNRGGGGQQEADRILPDVTPEQNQPPEDSAGDLPQTSPAEEVLSEETDVTPSKAEAVPTAAQEESIAESKSGETSKPVSAVQPETAAVSVKSPADTLQKSRGILPVAAVTLGALAAVGVFASRAYNKKKHKTEKHR